MQVIHTGGPGKPGGPIKPSNPLGPPSPISPFCPIGPYTTLDNISDSTLSWLVTQRKLSL